MSEFSDIKDYLISNPADSSDFNRKETITVFREIVNNNLFLFLTEVLGFGDIIIDLHGPIIKLLSDFNLEKIMILIPRGLFKSSVITIGYTIWRLCKDPNRTFLIYSYRASKSENFLSSIRENLQSNELLNELYPNVIPSSSEIRAKNWYTKSGYKKSIKWTDKQIILKRSIVTPASSIYTCGESTALASVHYDEELIDDCVTEENYETLNSRDSTDAKIKSLYPLLKAGKREYPSRQIFIGTRWCKDDQYERMARTHFSVGVKLGLHGNDEFQYYCRRALEEGKPVHPSLTREKLARIRDKDVGEFLFAASYMNDPKDAKDKVFDINKLRYYKSLPTKPLEDKYTGETKEVPRNINYFILHDPATGKAECDSVVLCVGVTDLQDIYCMKYCAGKYDLNEVIDQIIDFDIQFNPKVIAIEGFGYQRIIGYQLENQMKKQGRKTGAIKNVGNVKKSKDARIKSLQTIINRGRLFVKKEHKELIEQIDEYPAGLKDIIDALSYILFPEVWSPPNNDYRVESSYGDDPLILENIYSRDKKIATKKRNPGRSTLNRENFSVNRMPNRSDIFSSPYR